MDTAQFGRFWSEIASEYAETEDQSPLAKLSADMQIRRPEVQILDYPPLRRVFLKESNGRHLMQIQADRFLHSWRKASDSDEYPRFAQVYARFETAWERFLSFLNEQKFEEPVLQLWELTYLNHITADGAVFPRDVWDFLSFYRNSSEAITAQDATGKALQASNMFLHFDWTLPDNAAILSLEVKHGSRVPDQRPVLVLELTCRGKIILAESDLRSRFEIGHDAIVNTFAKLTSERGHNIWEMTK
jgi:uncharacterized protein (TIGR04255 family)